MGIVLDFRCVVGFDFGFVFETVFAGDILLLLGIRRRFWIAQEAIGEGIVIPIIANRS